jgi:serine protease Do
MQSAETPEVRFSTYCYQEFQNETLKPNETMKTSRFQMTLTAGAGLIAASAIFAEMTLPRVNGTEFDKKLSRDMTDTRVPGQMTSSYADVVQRILPSVVSIGTYSKTSKRSLNFEMSPDDLEHLPPLFRDFFWDWRDRRGPSEPREHKQKKNLPEKPVQTGLGSGVIITADGYILTNNHVVDDADELKVELAGKSREYTGKVVGTDPQTDVALIKIDAEGLTPATIGDSTKLRVGDVVLAIGSPMGLEQSVTQGIVSGLGRSNLGIIGNAPEGQPGYENFIQTDAAINPGNSGGPLLDAQGRVVGLNTAIETRSGMFAGIGLAIPVNMAISVARDLLEGGKVQRGFLGIEMDQLDASMAEYLGLEHEAGVIVNAVVADSPAAKAGFLEGDAIISINGQSVTSPAQLRLVVSAHHPGTEVKFVVVRYNEKLKHAEHIELIAKLRQLPDKLGGKVEETPSERKKGKPDNSFLKGVTIENLTDELRQDYKIADTVEGALVTSVDKDSAAALVLEDGDVIIQVNRKAVKNVAEAKAAIGGEGESVLLKVLRNGRTKLLIVKK